MIFKKASLHTDSLKLQGKQNNKRFSVSMKLNLVKVLIIISSLVSIIGAYEVQMGGKCMN